MMEDERAASGAAGAGAAPSTATRPALQPARDSGSSGGATTRGGASSQTVTGGSTPSEDDGSTAYFHSAASTLDGSGSHHHAVQASASPSTGSNTTDARALSDHLQAMSMQHSASSSSSKHSRRDPAQATTTSTTSRPEAVEDSDGVVRTDFAERPVDEQHRATDLPEQGASSTHFSVAPHAPVNTAHAAEAPQSTRSPSHHHPAHTTSHGYGSPEQAITAGASRRPSNPFIIQQHKDTPSPSSPREPSPSRQRSSPSMQNQKYTTSGPLTSRSQDHHASSSSSQKPQQNSNIPHTRQQSRAQRNIPVPNIDAAKQDYFSRHPDPDYNLRHGGATTTSSSSRGHRQGHSHSGGRPRSSGSQTTSDAVASERASFSGDEDLPSNANRDRADHSHHEALLSPALSVGTLSSGVSVGPSMGGYERIFPIRSVVAGQKPLPQPTPGQPSSSSSRYKPQDGRNTSYASSSARSQQQQQSNPVQSAGSVYSTSSGATALQQARQQKAPREDALNEEMEVGTDYSRRSPAPDDVSDFSFGSRNSRGSMGEGMRAPPRPHPEENTAHLDRGDPAAIYGDAAQLSPSVEKREDGIFQSSHASSPPSKPAYYRNDSLISQTTRSSDPAAVSSVSAHASSYPTTSRHSDDSDPTARKGTSTAPSTIAPTPGTGGSTASRKPGLTRIDSQDLGSDNDADRLHKKGVQFDHNDPTQAAREAYEKGEAEEGPSVESGGLGSLGIEQDGLFLTYRFEHQETEDGHMIVTGRKGELLKCEDEPIHIPGAIQDYGVLIAVEENDEGHFVVTQVSEVSACGRLQYLNCD